MKLRVFPLFLPFINFHFPPFRAHLTQFAVNYLSFRLTCSDLQWSNVRESLCVWWVGPVARGWFSQWRRINSLWTKTYFTIFYQFHHAPTLAGIFDLLSPIAILEIVIKEWHIILSHNGWLCTRNGDGHEVDYRTDGVTVTGTRCHRLFFGLSRRQITHAVLLSHTSFRVVVRLSSVPTFSVMLGAKFLVRCHR